MSSHHILVRRKPVAQSRPAEHKPRLQDDPPPGSQFSSPNQVPSLTILPPDDNEASGQQYQCVSAHTSHGSRASSVPSSRTERTRASGTSDDTSVSYHTSIEPSMLQTNSATPGDSHPYEHDPADTDIFENIWQYDMQIIMSDPDAWASFDPMVQRILHETAQKLLAGGSPKIGTPRVSGASLAKQAPSGNASDSSDVDEAGGDADQFGDFCCNVAQSLCAEDHEDISYCYACEMFFCPKHWDRTKPHARKKAGHEKIDARIAKLISSTLDTFNNQDEQARLHLVDHSASWFGAITDEDETVFRDFGRYTALMSEVSLEHRKRAYPALVSFVGDTGAGKSSLIKLLVKVQRQPASEDTGLGAQAQQTPVVGNAAASSPTSGDVHLYADPLTFLTERPVLYADCEGLRGGTLEPMGARLRRKMHATTRNRNRTNSFDKHERRRHDFSERDILWATSPEKRTRKYFVEQLYPRLLYTFSDVIVFVVKNAQMIEDVIEQLVVWADAVFESATNQPVLPYALVVLNASENQESKLWDVTTSTNVLMAELEQAVHKNPKLKKFAAKWISRGFSIESIQQLLLTYYSGFRVIRIPNKRLPSLVHSQIKQLYNELQSAITDVHKDKQQKRLRLNAEALAPYLQKAFDHFCIDLHNAFDFIRASFSDSGIPSDFRGNTIKLMMDIMDQWPDRIDDTLIFKEISFMVASCVMIHAVRHGRLGEAEPLFREYMDHFDETVDDFYEKVWPCEFVGPDGRCRNTRVGHVKGHQVGKGEVVAGVYQSSSDPDSTRKLYRDGIFGTLDELLGVLEQAQNEVEKAPSIHQSRVLENFYAHLGGAHLFVNHRMCLSCLVLPAEHCLPCGHVLCTACVCDYGKRRSRLLIEMQYCPLHKSATLGFRHQIGIKPDFVGARVLSLDGGGVRGLLILMTLQALEKDLGGIEIQNFFDLVVGTSTGGIIGLGLVEMGWSVDTALAKFWDLATEAFKKHKLLGMDVAEFLLSNYHGGRYKVEPLEELLCAQFARKSLFGGVFMPNGSSNAPCKVAVTTTSTSGTTFLLANYNRAERGEDSQYTFLREDKPNKEMKIWEAARCTSAAPRIFKPYVHPHSGHTFLDGGIYYNNPIEVALREHQLIWYKDKSRLPDMMLSLGTGQTTKGAESPRFANPFKSSINLVGQFTQNYKQLLKIATDHVKSSLRSEAQFQRILSHYPDTRATRNAFSRFNYFFPPERSKYETDSVVKMPDMERFARVDLLTRKHEIRSITNRLIASSFYFDAEDGTPDVLPGGTMAVQGRIRCRFLNYSHEMHLFGDLLRSRIDHAKKQGGRQHTPCFVIQDLTRPHEAEQIILSDDILDEMQRPGIFKLEAVIKVSSYQADSDISLRFGNESIDADDNSISGFPRCWDDRRLTPVTSRLILRDAMARSVSNRKRPDWKPNKSAKMSLPQYAKAVNPGLADDNELTAVQYRLSSPGPPSMTSTHASAHSQLQGYYGEKAGGQTHYFEDVYVPYHRSQTPDVPDGRYGTPVEIMTEKSTEPLARRSVPGMHELG